MKKIDENSTLKQILDIPGSSEILQKHGVPCISCPMASMEMGKLKIGKIAEIYGLNLKNILKALNK